MRFARWLTLALFGFVSVLGHGLHLLDCHCESHPHGEPPTVTAAASADDHVCGHCGHRHAAERSAPHGGPGIRSASGHDDDCLICRFFAQGKLAAGETPPLSRPFAATHRAALAIDVPFLAAPEPYQARGPPAIL